MALLSQEYLTGKFRLEFNEASSLGKQTCQTTEQPSAERKTA